MIKDFKAVLFDMDGTLIDSEKLWRKAEHLCLSAWGIAEADIPKLQLGFIGMSVGEVMHMIKERYALKMSALDMALSLESKVKEFLGEVEICLGAQDFVAAISRLGLKMAIASNSSSPIITASLQEQRWLDVIPTRISCDDVAYAKPAPDIYLYAAQQLATEPKDCLVIEDSLTGVKAAVAAGMTCFAVPNDHRLALSDYHALTPYVFKDLTKAQAFLAL